MADRQFELERLAALYDRFYPPDQRADFRYYLDLIMGADSVLDVGCGTGALLHAARDAGHAGRLAGIDPAVGMLDQARRRNDVEWVLGDVADAAWDREFELIVMTGHAFQVLVDDTELRTTLAAIRTALTEDGRFVFETRNPAARAWETWTPDRVAEAIDDSGAVVREWTTVNKGLSSGGLVRFTTTFECDQWPEPITSTSTLRFLDAPSVARFLQDAGFAVERQVGDWSNGPLTDSSPEIITVARRDRRAGRTRRRAPLDTMAP